jgi:hypothetical protein
VCCGVSWVVGSFLGQAIPSAVCCTAELCPTSSDTMEFVHMQTHHLLTELHRHKMRQGAVPDASVVGFCQWHCKRRPCASQPRCKAVCGATYLCTARLQCAS